MQLCRDRHPTSRVDRFTKNWWGLFLTCMATRRLS